MGGLSDQNTNRHLLLTSYLLWHRYTTSGLRLWIRTKLRNFETKKTELKIREIVVSKIPEILDPNFDLATKGFLFVESFFDENTYKQLLKAWPKKRWFEPLVFRQNGKSYDSGLRWNIPKKIFDESITHNPGIHSVYQALRSEKFCCNISSICDDNIQRDGYAMLLTQSYSHSYLTPHKDSRGSDADINNSIVNIILFVQANGKGWEAGGTSILGDATFSKPIFIPSNLNNTALIYRNTADFWHGFPRIARGKYRRTVLSAYQLKS